ncbi:MAG: DUF624 domain-containing protein [Candidatus Cohnella colombiensis]|uniref:DUF624 domain-containing protein n=1 Tax=Candidatus Cohnella colombiensis TaxID=3121368 RepID=A0AA95JCP1_9BACL|nr:MAG: DUF624 domain-containing protein [Cohnella sp.]
MEMRGMMGGFYKLSEWIMRLSVTNVLWLLFSIPFWFIIISVLNLPIPEDIIIVDGDINSVIKAGWWLLGNMLLLPLILAPFTFFPATSAMFSVARKWVTGDVDVPLFKTFFQSYKSNFKQAMLGGILYSLLILILVVDYIFFIEHFPVVGYLFIFLMFLTVVSMFHYFSLLSHFHMKTLQLLKNALILTIGRPIRSLLIVFGIVAVFLILRQFPVLFLFFSGSIVAVYTFYHFNLVVQKMIIQREAIEAKEGQDGQATDDGKQSQA